MIVSRETIAHLFAHEATRVFHDRLTNQDDRRTFFDFLSDDLHNYFKVRLRYSVLINFTSTFCQKLSLI